MLQFYFLSIFLNLVAGYLLIFSEESVAFDSKDADPRTSTFRLIIGVLALLMGIIKFFSPIGGSIPVIGDFVPAVAGILGGSILLFDFYRHRTSIRDSEGTKKIEGVLTVNKKLIGALGLIAALLHFLFPRVPLI